jgi:hypothetical protein
MAQWKSDTQTFDQLISRRYEVMVVADASGNVNSSYNPLFISEAPGSYTSKNRQKVSDYQTVFFNTFQYNIESDVWDQALYTNGTATFNANTNNVDLAVTNEIGSKVIRQTKNAMRYIPGRTSTLTYAMRLGITTAGIRKRIGLFDENDGFFFEFGDTGDYHCVVRSKTTGSVVDRRVDRADWNGDKLDGTGPSGIILNPNTQQMINFEYEWYGAGQIIFSFTIDGRSHIIHTFNNGNVLSVPWASTPFLPIRLELENLTGGQTGGPFYLYQGSNSLISEGTPDKLGISANKTSPITGTRMGSANAWYPVLSIRLAADNLKGIVLPTFFQVATIDNTSIFYKLVKNPVIGTGGSSWTSLEDQNSFSEFQIYTNPSAITEANSGVQLDSGFVISGSGTGIALNKDVVLQIGRSSLGTVSDVITILAASPGTGKDAVAALTWIEQR